MDFYSADLDMLMSGWNTLYCVSCSNPWIELDFGPRADFRVAAIMIDSQCSITQTLGVEVERATGIRGQVERFWFENNRIDFDRKVKCRKLRLVQRALPEYRMNVMRIKSLDVVGGFRR
jgi:hypothetical protein